MKSFKVSFKLHEGVRKSGVMSNYRPTWWSDSKPEHNCGVLSFNDIEIIQLGESHECLLTPLVPTMWLAVGLNDILKCMEGSREVGEATILEVIK